jgi:hypothetical protein
VDRRKFLASVAVAGTTSTMPLAATAATQANPVTPPVGQRPSALPPNVHIAAAETGTAKDLPRIGGRAGSERLIFGPEPNKRLNSAGFITCWMRY